MQTSNTAAASLAQELLKPLSNAFGRLSTFTSIRQCNCTDLESVKNRYIYRTFIVSRSASGPHVPWSDILKLPGQKARQKSVRRKLSPIASEFKGKVVCLVDDSIVRGTTSKEIVRLGGKPGGSGITDADCLLGSNGEGV